MNKPPIASRPKPKTLKPAHAEGADMPGSMRQLGIIRARFTAIPADLAEALLAHHTESSCRAKGGATRAADVFRIGMSWARTCGEHPDDPAVSKVRVRWFLDCLTTLGRMITGEAPSGDPSREATYEDAIHAADELLRETVEQLRNAVGTNPTWGAQLDTALAVVARGDERVSRLQSLAAQTDTWLGSKGSPPLAAYDVTRETVVALRNTAKKLDDAQVHRPAPKQAERDSPTVNIAEGRVLYAMRAVWDDFAQARAKGKSQLQLTVSPTVLRGLDLKVRKHKSGVANAPAQVPAPATSVTKS